LKDSSGPATTDEKRSGDGRGRLAKEWVRPIGVIYRSDRNHHCRKKVVEILKGSE
jgi:hypothetical protein